MTDLIRGLAAEARRAMSRNLFEGFYERGLSANAALQELRALGLGYRRADFLRDFSAGKLTYDQASKIRFVNLDKTPSESILEPKYLGVPDKYSILFRAEGLDPELGEEATRYFYYHRNSLLSRGEMEEEAQEYIESDRDRYSLVVSKVTAIRGYINPVWA